MDTADIIIKIRKIVRSINLESKKIQKDYGVSIPQVLCLNFLHQSPNYQSTQGEIRKFLNLNSSTVNGIISRLESKGLISRLPKSGDKRVVNIALTLAGDNLLKNIPSRLHDRLSKKLKSLSPDTLQTLEDSLDTLITLLEIESIDPTPVIVPEENI